MSDVRFAYQKRVESSCSPRRCRHPSSNICHLTSARGRGENPHLFFSFLLCAQAARAVPFCRQKGTKDRRRGRFLLRCPKPAGAAVAAAGFDRCANTSFLHLPQAAVGCVAPFGNPLGPICFSARLALIPAPQQATEEAAGGYLHHHTRLFRRAALLLAHHWQAGILWAACKNLTISDDKNVGGQRQYFLSATSGSADNL